MSIKLIGQGRLTETTTTAGQIVPGTVVVCHHTTYGPVVAWYCYSVEAVGVVGSPMYPEYADFDTTGNFQVSDNENGTGVLGLEWCLGSWLGGVTTAAGYGFVQTFGWNMAAITTDDSVAALDVVLPTTTDGTWAGVSLAALCTDATAVATSRVGFSPAADGGTTMAVQTVHWNSQYFNAALPTL